MSYNTLYSTSAALVIGIDQYQHCSPLSNACNDARSVAKALETYARFPPASIRLLLNEEASKSKILAEFFEFRNRCAADDRIVVFFAGHGHSESGNRKQQGFLVPVDGTINNLATLIRWQELAEGAEMIPAKHVLFVMDACFSGLLMQRASVPTGSRFVSDMLQRYSRQAITAGKANEVVADGGRGTNSIFTEHFIEGLSGAAADRGGIITASSAMNYAYRKVAQDPRSGQTPHYGHLEGDGDMILTFPNRAPIDVNTSGDHLTEDVLEVPESSTSGLAPAPNADESDPKKEELHNSRSQRLARTHWENGKAVSGPAEHFISISATPSGKIWNTPKLTEIARRLQNESRQNPEPPYWGFLVPNQLRTTLNAVLLYEPNRDYNQGLTRYIHLTEGGTVEIAETENIVHYWSPRDDENSPRYVCWHYVATIGFIWSSLELLRRTYIELGYTGGIRLAINMVNSKGGRLVDYSEVKGVDEKWWRNPFSVEARMYHNAPGGRECEDEHIRLRYQLTQGDFKEPAAKKLVDDIAAKIGLAFDKHEAHLLCYNFGTADFPWNQFAHNWSR